MAMTTEGVILQMMGVALEAIGAILLIGNYVGRKFKRVRDWGPYRPMQDLAMDDSRARERTWFFSIIGAFVLASGFTLQLSGIVLEFSSSWEWALLVGITMALVVLAIAHFLVRLGTNQSYGEIFDILASNLRGALFGRSRQLRCEGCRKIMHDENFEVWWIEMFEKEIEFIHFGHPDCLERIDGYPPEPIEVHGEPFKKTVKLAMPDLVRTGLPLKVGSNDPKSEEKLKRLGIPRNDS